MTRKKNAHTQNKNKNMLFGVEGGNSKFGTWGYLRTDGLKSSINRQKLIKIKGLRANKVAQ